MPKTGSSHKSALTNNEGHLRHDECCAGSIGAQFSAYPHTLPTL